ncbi:MAG: ATP-dependent DNA helicase RecG [Candidatus Binataceae bacterium]
MRERGLANQSKIVRQAILTSGNDTAAPQPLPISRTPVAALTGIGPKRAAMLQERGIETVFDLLMHLPARYQDWRVRYSPAELQPGIMAAVEGRLENLSERPMPGARWRRVMSGWISAGEAGRVRVVWFNLPGYMRARLPEGELIAAYGRASIAPDGQLEIAHPELYRISAEIQPGLQPIYRLPWDSGQRLYRNIVAAALEKFAPGICGAIPDEIREGAGIPSVANALHELHSPSSDADLFKLQNGGSEAHRALAIDEMFAFQLALLVERTRMERRPAPPLTAPGKLTSALLKSIPFRLTDAQHTAIGEIGADLERPRQMNRLLMGDVGSGKTLVAFWAALRAIESGYQVVMMAPTELLAEQHYRSFERLCAALQIRSSFLTGNISKALRAKILRGFGRREVSMLFGTQALIQEGVRAAKLGLAIIDEQHRFGVFERARLMALGPNAHILLMTATPIPRSLAMMLLANLELSILDEMPAGRKPIRCEIFEEEELGTVHALIGEELARGNRAYYVMPLIEGEEDAPSVIAMTKRLRQGTLGRFRIGVLHGRMSAVEKERIMREFRDGGIQALVSTTVVEVGIDVPEATVIAITAAERYGLAQLHQLRGRVGRGAAPSRCCLIISRGADRGARERLRLLAGSKNGEEVARADLERRGPGDLLGARQSGALPLRFARFIGDYALIEQSRAMAVKWLERDPDLVSPASAGCREALARMFNQGFSLGDVG